MKKKRCTKCGDDKLLSAFLPGRHDPKKRQARCRMCQSDTSKEWVRKNKKRALATRARWHRENKAKVAAAQRKYHLKRKYNLTPEEYAEFCEKNKGGCDVCGSTEQTSPVVDHCHKTKRVRGVLCHRCNVGIGLFRDSPKLLRAAAKYLEAVRS